MCIDGPPYDFTFTLGPPLFLSTFDLAPGGTYDFQLGTFTPTGGSDAPGTYKFYIAGFFLGIDGLDDMGNAVYAPIDLGWTCWQPGGIDCAFTRTVTADQSGDVVPELQTLLRLATGMAGLAVVPRRRRRA